MTFGSIRRAFISFPVVHRSFTPRQSSVHQPSLASPRTRLSWKEASMTRFRKHAGALGGLLALSLVAAACGGDEGGTSDGGANSTEAVSGSLNISGSSTVEPITSLNAEKFQAENPDVQIAVDGPGTSDGFELFCNGETDIQDASRAIDEEEVAACEKGGVEYIELQVANDALTVVVNPANPIECMNLGDIYALFGPESQGFENWSDANDLAAEVGGNGDFPDQPLTIVAPGEESGTYGSFIELTVEDIAAERGEPDDQLRPDYQISADDNVIIENAAGTESGLGFVGFSFAQNAGESVKEMPIDGGEGCVEPSAENVINETYPISRPLFIYVNTEKLASNPAVRPFVDFYLTDEGLVTSVEEVQYVVMSQEQIDSTRSTWDTEGAA
jgi:phosphate transport system substrate-binding protein